MNLIPHNLNLGCGKRRLDDCLNIDLSLDSDADLVVDLNSRPWRLPENHFVRIHAYDVIEHLEDVVATMREIHRVSAPNGRLHITVPHYSSSNAYSDPTHLHQFGAASFDEFGRGGRFDFGGQGHFRLVRRQIFFHPSFLNKLVWRLANRFVEGYERRWAWIFPAWFLELELEIVKP